MIRISKHFHWPFHCPFPFHFTSRNIRSFCGLRIWPIRIFEYEKCQTVFFLVSFSVLNYCSAAGLRQCIRSSEVWFSMQPMQIMAHYEYFLSGNVWTANDCNEIGHQQRTTNPSSISQPRWLMNNKFEIIWIFFSGQSNKKTLTFAPNYFEIYAISTSAGK